MSRARILVIAGLVALLLAAGAVWWFVFRDTSPPAPTLEGAVAERTSTTEGSATTPQTDGGIEGEWVLADDGTSYVGYRVREELASIGAKTAVGRTPLVEAALVVEGGAVTTVQVDADLTGLQSDDDRRDGAIRRQALETATFPDAAFTLTAPITLPAGAADGEPIEVSGTGDLTLHGVTRTVEVPLQAQLVDGRIVVVGSVEIAFADYDIDKPTSFAVLSVEDVGVMELLLVFEPSA
ncbi:MAG: YceI family protein [Actinobacteria bacterium]|nr:YceI family protein [Actinomycetota bacterium]